MKRFFAWGLATIFLITIITTALAGIKDSPNGFRGLKWGDPLSLLGKDIELLEDDPNGQIQIYSRKDEKLKLGGASLSKIGYYFWKNKFIMVEIRTKNSSEFDSLKQVAIARFGAPISHDDIKQEYYWLDTNAFISLKRYSYPCLDIISNKYLIASQKTDEEKAKEGAAKDF